MWQKPLLFQNLTYRTSAAIDNQLTPQGFDSNTHLYATPAPEFDVIRVEVAADESIILQALSTCSIVITLQGHAERTDKRALFTGVLRNHRMFFS